MPSEVIPPHDAKPVEVNGQVVNPQDHYAKDSKHTDHIIVTVNQILSNDQKAELQSLKVDLLEDLGNRNLLCRYTPTDLKPLRALPFVTQCEVYPNLFKIPAQLGALIENPDSVDGSEDSNALAQGGPREIAVDIMLHQDVKDTASALADDLAKVAHLDRNAMEVLSDMIRCTINPSFLHAVAADDRVRIIEEVITPVLSDSLAKKVVSAPSKTHPDSKYGGKGQIIAVIDSGFDLGSTDDCHPAFSGQIDKIIPMGRAGEKDMNEAQKVDDPIGHGTHVCGTIVGKEVLTSEGLVGGVAPHAKVIFLSLLNRDYKLAPDLDVKKVWEIPFSGGARILSNSWGDGLGSQCRQMPYARASEAIDGFVRENPDCLICFSAGNENEKIFNQKPPRGVPKPAIGSQAAAKNCLTVGASGSIREISNSSGKIDKVDPNLMSVMSSRGPTLEGRIKPDVCAPGYNIFSAQSRHPEALEHKGTDATSQDHPDVRWRIRSGTSHSTPLVSGCAAILRQILQKRGLSKPPAALLKAYLINGANTLPGVDRDAQGFGRINLQSSVAMLESAPATSKDALDTPLSPVGGGLIGSSLKQGKVLEFALAPIAADTDVSFKITMTYNDLPGGAIQNNLNLTVTDTTTGTTHHGGISVHDLTKQNNVEQVCLLGAPHCVLKVSVLAQFLFRLGDQQDFALAWSATPVAK